MEDTSSVGVYSSNKNGYAPASSASSIAAGTPFDQMQTVQKGNKARSRKQKTPVKTDVRRKILQTQLLNLLDVRKEAKSGPSSPASLTPPSSPTLYHQTPSAVLKNPKEIVFIDLSQELEEEDRVVKEKEKRRKEEHQQLTPHSDPISRRDAAVYSSLASSSTHRSSVKSKGKSSSVSRKGYSNKNNNNNRDSSLAGGLQNVPTSAAAVEPEEEEQTHQEDQLMINSGDSGGSPPGGESLSNSPEHAQIPQPTVATTSMGMIVGLTTMYSSSPPSSPATINRAAQVAVSSSSTKKKKPRMNVPTASSAATHATSTGNNNNNNNNNSNAHGNREMISLGTNDYITLAAQHQQMSKAARPQSPPSGAYSSASEQQKQQQQQQHDGSKTAASNNKSPTCEKRKRVRKRGSTFTFFSFSSDSQQPHTTTTSLSPSSSSSGPGSGAASPYSNSSSSSSNAATNATLGGKTQVAIAPKPTTTLTSSASTQPNASSQLYVPIAPIPSTSTDLRHQPPHQIVTRPYSYSYPLPNSFLHPNSALSLPPYCNNIVPGIDSTPNVPPTNLVVPTISPTASPTTNTNIKRLQTLVTTKSTAKATTTGKGTNNNNKNIRAVKSYGNIVVNPNWIPTSSSSSLVPTVSPSSVISSTSSSTPVSQPIKPTAVVPSSSYCPASPPASSKMTRAKKCLKPSPCPGVPAVMVSIRCSSEGTIVPISKSGSSLPNPLKGQGPTPTLAEGRSPRQIVMKEAGTNSSAKARPLDSTSTPPDSPNHHLKKASSLPYLPNFPGLISIDDLGTATDLASASAYSDLFLQGHDAHTISDMIEHMSLDRDLFSTTSASTGKLTPTSQMAVDLNGDHRGGGDEGRASDGSNAPTLFPSHLDEDEDEDDDDNATTRTGGRIKSVHTSLTTQLPSDEDELKLSPSEEQAFMELLFPEGLDFAGMCLGPSSEDTEEEEHSTAPKDNTSNRHTTATSVTKPNSGGGDPNTAADCNTARYQLQQQHQQQQNQASRPEKTKEEEQEEDHNHHPSTTTSSGGVTGAVGVGGGGVDVGGGGFKMEDIIEEDLILPFLDAAFLNALDDANKESGSGAGGQGGGGSASNTTTPRQPALNHHDSLLSSLDSHAHEVYF